MASKLKMVSYKTALLKETVRAIPDIPCDANASVVTCPINEYTNDVFDDACGPDLLSYYIEFEEHMRSNGLMSLGKSYEVIQILYSCMKVVRVREDVSTSESECDTDDLLQDEAWSSWY